MMGMGGMAAVMPALMGAAGGAMMGMAGAGGGAQMAAVDKARNIETWRKTRLCQEFVTSGSCK